MLMEHVREFGSISLCIVVVIVYDHHMIRISKQCCFCDRTQMFTMKMFYFVIILSLSKTSNQDWYYGHEDEWPGLCKNGKRQSPINIINTNCSTHVTPEPLHLFNYGSRFDSLIINNGHSVEVRLINNNDVPILSGGILTQYYVLDNIHFHWLSEHMIDFIRFPLEAHFVHYDKQFANLSEASNSINSIVVISVLFENGRNENSFFEFLFKKNIYEINSSVKMNFHIDSLLPANISDYYSYDGSLTTPGCYENVKWIVFRKPQSIPLEYILKFQELKTYHGELKRNFRPLQNLNNRVVVLYKEQNLSTNQSDHFKLSMIWILFCCMITKMFRF